MEVNKTQQRNVLSSFSIIVIFIIFIIIGFAFIPVLNVRYKPSRDLPQLNIRYSWANASPKVIEEETSKIEGILGKVSQIKSIESISSIGNGEVILKFDKNVNLNKKRYEVSSLIKQISDLLPEEIGYPEITSNISKEEDRTTFIVLTINANSSTYYIRKIAEKLVVPELMKISSISDIHLFGANTNHWEICYDPQLLNNYSITSNAISNSINELGSKTYLGNQTDDNGSLIPLLASSKNLNPNKWGGLPIANRGGRIIKLEDVASIKYKEKLPSSYYRINGKNAIYLIISSEYGKNQIRLAKNILRQIKSIQHSLPVGYTIDLTYNSVEYINCELSKIGMRTLFSFIILLLFVLITSRSFSILSILTISLIANLLIACFAYYLFSIEVHIYSLAGITVSLGIIIDNSIIVITHLHKHKDLNVFVSVFASTLTTIGALTVVFFLDENQKNMLIDFTYVMLINLTVSLIVSFFLIPALMEKINDKRPHNVVKFRTRRNIVRTTQKYGFIINIIRRYKLIFILIAILGFGIPIWMIPNKIENNSRIAELYNTTLGTNRFQKNIKPVLEKVFGGSLRLFTKYVYTGSFYIDPGETKLYILGRMPDGCTVHQLNDVIKEIEKYIGSFEGIKQFETRISDYDNSVIIVQFTDNAIKTLFPLKFRQKIESKVLMYGDLDWIVFGVGKFFSNAMNTERKKNEILLKGYNYDRTYKYAEQLKDKLLINARVSNIQITCPYGRNTSLHYEYDLQVDKEFLSFQDLNYFDYTSSLFSQLYYNNLNPYYSDDEMQPITLVSKIKKDYKVWNFYNTPVHTSKGLKKLSQSSEIKKELTEKSIYKKNQEYQLYLSYDFIGPEPVAKKYQKKEVEEMCNLLPLGYKVEISPQNNYPINKEKNQYWFIIIIIVIIFFITAILFESLLKPFAVISLIPISFIGVFLTFFLFDFNFDQGGFASFILLSGLVVNSSIYIINDFNNLISHNNRPLTIKTYLKAFNNKVIAIFLTIFSTVLGLIPFVWNGQNEVFWFSFAVGAMGGLIFSFIALLIYLPIFIKLIKNK